MKVGRCLKVDVYSTKDDLFTFEHCCNGIATQPVSATTVYICKYDIINIGTNIILYETLVAWTRLVWILWYILCVNLAYSIDNSFVCVFFLTLYSCESRCIIILTQLYIILLYTYLEKCFIIYIIHGVCRYIYIHYMSG